MTNNSVISLLSFASLALTACGVGPGTGPEAAATPQNSARLEAQALSATSASTRPFATSMVSGVIQIGDESRKLTIVFSEALQAGKTFTFDGVSASARYSEAAAPLPPKEAQGFKLRSTWTATEGSLTVTEVTAEKVSFTATALKFKPSASGETDRATGSFALSGTIATQAWNSNQ
jgi:hypothetical protein